MLKDGTSNTVAVVIALKEDAVVWLKPDELTLSPDKIVHQLFGSTDSISVGMFDGSVQRVSRATLLLRGRATKTARSSHGAGG